MPQIPPLPARGSIPNAIWVVFERIIAYIRSLPIRGDNKTIKVSQTDGAFVISAIAGGLSAGANGFLQKEVFFLEVTDIDSNGCPGTQEWHKYTIPIILDSTEDPPTA